MSSNQSPTDNQKFFSIAVSLNLLSNELAKELAAESTKEGIHPTHLSLKKGLLNAVQIDIIETLLNPDGTVADFEIQGLLGKGGMGVVYRARQKSLDRVVALKTVLVSQLTDPALATRFEREAMTVAKLQHPHIVTAYDFGKHDGRMYFVMELVEGQDVDQLIKQRWRLGEATALGLIRQAAAGLSHATELNIVHRDIKPANLLLVEPPTGYPLPKGLPMVKIADFGLAFLSNDNQAETRLTQANTTLGSPNYMAPEQITGEEIDHRADIYALGATLYHMLAGQPPFQAETISQIIAKKLSGIYTPLDESNPAVSTLTCQLVVDMMNHDPETRLADYSNLINRIDESILQCQPAVSPDMLLQAEGQPSTGVMEKTMIAGARATLPAMDNIPEKKTLQKSWFWAIPVSVLVALVLIVLIYSTQWFGKQPVEVPERNMVRSGWGKSLFNGETLGALPISGGWTVQTNDEGGKVIAGTSGVIRQPLLRRDLKGTRPLHNYQLHLFVRLHEATAVELQFGISSQKNQSKELSALRVTSKQVTLGHRTGENSLFEPVSQAVKLNVKQDKLHVIQLEFQHDTWWVLFDDRLIGTIRSQSNRHLPEFRLLVEDGPAWFSDLAVEELIPKPKQQDAKK